MTDQSPPYDVSRTPLLGFLLRLPLKKLTIWVAFLGLLLILRDFFPLIFMTFVLSYIAQSVVSKVEHKFSARWIPIVLFFSLVVTGVGGLVWVTVPRLRAEGAEVTEEIARHKHWNNWLDFKLREGLGKDAYAKLESEIAGGLPSPTTDEPIGANSDGGHGSGIARVESKSVSAWLVGRISHEKREELLGKLGAVGKAVWTGIVYVFLTILFSLMLVWGLPGFKQGLKQLERSRVSEIYREVQPSILQFGRLLGRAFEAQTLIAAVNTCITLAGMQIIGIPGAFGLSIVVFLCSFIPVAGVFISTTPIALVGLFMQGGGVGKLVSVVIMVTVAHIVEAYILNPRIYGHHMRMNPLAVLGILLIAEHTVGVWGLVIAIPLSTYVWRHVILGEPGDDAVPAPGPVAAPPAAPSTEPAPAGGPAPAEG